MIDVKELRIDNYLTIPGLDRMVKVSALFLTHFRCRGLDGIDYEESIRVNYSGIPLTPELLLQCGFENRMGNFYWLDYGADLHFQLENGVLVPEDYYTSQPFTEEAYPRYLHQLQNVIFWLTKKELTLLNNQ